MPIVRWPAARHGHLDSWPRRGRQGPLATRASRSPLRRRRSSRRSAAARWTSQSTLISPRHRGFRLGLRPCAQTGEIPARPVLDRRPHEQPGEPEKSQSASTESAASSGKPRIRLPAVAPSGGVGHPPPTGLSGASRLNGTADGCRFATNARLQPPRSPATSPTPTARRLRGLPLGRETRGLE